MITIYDINALILILKNKIKNTSTKLNIYLEEINFMELRRNFDTVTEAVNDLAERGYTTDLAIDDGDDCLTSKQTSLQLSPDEFEIDEIYRCEGNTDPGDEMIVYAISSEKHNIKGVVVNGFGVYSSSAGNKIVEKLSKSDDSRKAKYRN